MKLLTKEILSLFEKTGRQDKVKDPLVITKYFYPAGAATWYATEYYPEDRLFFGFCDIFGDPTCAEWGYFSLDEIENFKGRFGLGIERDLYFRPVKVSECGELQRRMGNR